jgi:glycosyltransferase involved in cell wall biosynthesis
MDDIEVMRSKQSILFLVPDYHCSFTYRDQFRKNGWKADIYVPYSYPEKLLYSSNDLLKPPKLPGAHIRMIFWLNHLLKLLWWLTKFWRYEFHIYYGKPPAFNFMEQRIGLTRLFGSNFLVELWLAKIFEVKLVFLPTGCHDDESKESFTKLDGGNVCGNCGTFNRCDDVLNRLNFARINRYFDMQIGVGAVDSTQFRMTHIKYKSIDLNLWRPNLAVPPEHRLPYSDNIRVLHSAYLVNSGRNWQGRNIKGSSFVLAAIERLKNEGHPVEYFFIHDKPSNQMRFYQVQADIVVEQLIYGWWGSTFVETSALGKPVVCYLRPAWKEFFFKTFPEYISLPIVEADTQSIYEVLKRLVTDAGYRQRKGEESRRFAEAHFDAAKNTAELIKVLEAL